MKRNIGYVLALVIFAGFALIGCKKVGASTDEYSKTLEEAAAKFNASCPKDEPNGTRLESVCYKNNTMTFRLSGSDESITSVNLDSARSSIIRKMPESIKKVLVKSNSNLEYKYVSPNDSSSITILPNELK